MIGLKGNQGKLHKDVKRFFKEHQDQNSGSNSVQTVDGDHGRTPTRRYTVCSDIDRLRKQHQWPGLTSVIMAEYTREIRDRTKTIRRYYIASLKAAPENMARHIRHHWQVENSLHWVLDVTFRQDECRIRTGNAAANFATMEQAAMNLLRREPGKMSLPQKRHSAAWDDDYMETIIRQ